MHTQSQHKRPTIGLLNEQLQLSQNYASAVQWGAIDKARQFDVNLLCFIGGGLRSPVEFAAQGNVLYDWVGRESVDGVLILSGLLSSNVAPAEFAEFCNRYRPLPLVSVGLKMEGIPSVTVENYAGVREAVAHLIRVHNYRRIAFICGPKGNREAEERYRGYVDALAEHGLEINVDLIAPGDFRPASGSAAIELLLDQRQVDLDAVVVANDDMALAALEALQVRGRHVPRDVAVVGFDNIQETECIPVPLTTVQQPMYSLGQRAVEMLLAQLAGRDVPMHVTMPARLVVRRSCGCVDVRAGGTATEPIPAASQELDVASAPRRDEVLSQMARVAGVFEGIPEWTGRLLDAFLISLRDESFGVFLKELNENLQRASSAGGDVGVWSDVILTLHHLVLPHLDPKELSLAMDLLQQAYVLVGETLQRLDARQTVWLQEQAQNLRSIGQNLITTFDLDGLVNVLAQDLPELDISSAYLALYEDSASSARQLRLILAYDGETRAQIEPERCRYPAVRLVPSEFLPERQYSYVVEPLYFRDRQLGIMLLEIEPREGYVYEALRGEISSALQGALLLRERGRAEAALGEAYAQVEQQVTERTAQLQREIAERERAQVENLRLQEEMIEAQKRAIQELSTPIIPVMERVIIMPLIGSIDTLRARDVTRRLLEGIREHRARVVILDITGVPIVDSGVAVYLNKTIQAARLKGARTIVTGVSDAVAETIVDLGIDWSGIETLSDLQTGLQAMLQRRTLTREGQ